MQSPAYNIFAYKDAFLRRDTKTFWTAKEKTLLFVSFLFVIANVSVLEAQQSLQICFAFYIDFFICFI